MLQAPLDRQPFGAYWSKFKLVHECVICFGSTILDLKFSEKKIRKRGVNFASCPDHQKPTLCHCILYIQKYSLDNYLRSHGCSNRQPVSCAHCLWYYSEKCSKYDNRNGEKVINRTTNLLKTYVHVGRNISFILSKNQDCLLV